MRYGLAALIAGLAFAVGCGDDNAGSGRVELTVQNASGEQIAVYINGEQTQLDDGQEDAITLTGPDPYAILATGLESGATLYTESLTADEIEEMGNRLVIVSAPSIDG